MSNVVGNTISPFYRENAPSRHAKWTNNIENINKRYSVNLFSLYKLGSMKSHIDSLLLPSPKAYEAYEKLISELLSNTLGSGYDGETVSGVPVADCLEELLGKMMPERPCSPNRFSYILTGEGSAKLSDILDFYVRNDLALLHECLQSAIIENLSTNNFRENPALPANGRLFRNRNYYEVLEGKSPWYGMNKHANDTFHLFPDLQDGRIDDSTRYDNLWDNILANTQSDYPFMSMAFLRLFGINSVFALMPILSRQYTTEALNMARPFQYLSKQDLVKYVALCDILNRRQCAKAAKNIQTKHTAVYAQSAECVLNGWDITRLATVGCPFSLITKHSAYYDHAEYATLLGETELTQAMSKPRNFYSVIRPLLATMYILELSGDLLAVDEVTGMTCRKIFFHTGFDEPTTAYSTWDRFLDVYNNKADLYELLRRKGSGQYVLRVMDNQRAADVRAAVDLIIGDNEERRRSLRLRTSNSNSQCIWVKYDKNTESLGIPSERFSMRCVGYEFEWHDGAKNVDMQLEMLTKYPSFGMDEDGSIRSESGLEYVTSRMGGSCIDEVVREMYALAKKFKVNTQHPSCGLHIHVDTRDMYRELNALWSTTLNSDARLAKKYESNFVAYGDAMVKLCRKFVLPNRVDNQFCYGGFALRAKSGHTHPSFKTRNLKRINYPAIAVREQTIEFRLWPSTLDREFVIARTELSQKLIDKMAVLMNSGDQDCVQVYIEAINSILTYRGDVFTAKGWDKFVSSNMSELQRTLGLSDATASTLTHMFKEFQNPNIQESHTDIVMAYEQDAS